MKNVCLSLMICLFAGVIYGKGFEIIVKDSQSEYDSLYIQLYDGISKYKNLYGIKFSEKSIFKDDNALKPGIYLLAGDSTILTEFFISDFKDQKFTIIISNSGVAFENSPENIALSEYHAQIRTFENQFRELDNEFKAIKQQGLPQYMMQSMVDSLIKKANKITENKLLYQRETIAKYSDFFTGILHQNRHGDSYPASKFLSKPAPYATIFSQSLFRQFPLGRRTSSQFPNSE